jgi:hypothetical protein
VGEPSNKRDGELADGGAPLATLVADRAPARDGGSGAGRGRAATAGGRRRWGSPHAHGAAGGGYAKTHGARRKLCARAVGGCWASAGTVQERANNSGRAEVSRPPVLGECPKCRGEGRAGMLRLVKGMYRDSGQGFEFAGCDADTKRLRVCGYTAPARDGHLEAGRTACPECGVVMRTGRRRDGGHCLVCRRHGWFLADRAWTLVKAPNCSGCSRPMTHRERSDIKGQFFWACFEHAEFIDADAFGAVRVDSGRMDAGQLDTKGGNE